MKTLRFLLASLCLSAATLHGATFNWNALVAGADWSVAGSWSPGVPANDGTADLVFGLAMETTPDLDANWDVDSLTFSSTTAGAYVLGSSSARTLTIRSGGIINNDTATQTITHALALGAAQFWTAAFGPLDISGDVANGGFLLTISATASGSTISGAISGLGGLTLSGGGSLTLSGAGANTHSGLTRVDTGTLLLAKSGVNAIAGTLQVGDGSGGALADVARLASAGQIADTAKVQVLGSGLLDLEGASETVGLLEMGETSVAGANGGTIQTDGGSLTVSSMDMAGGTITLGAGTLFLGGNVSVAANGTAAASISGAVDLGTTRSFAVDDGSAAEDLTITGAISGGVSAGITKSGTGRLRFAGATSNTYSGTTSVVGGLLVLAKTGGATAIAGPLSIGDASGTDTVSLSGNDQIADTSTVRLFRGGVLDLFGSNDTIGALLFGGFGAAAGGTVQGSGTLTLAGNVTLDDATSASAPPAINSQLSLGAATRTFTVLEVATGADLTVGGAVSGSGGLTKTGAGELRLSGTAANTYAGTTTVNAGTLSLGKTASVNAVAGDLVIGDGSGTDTLQLTQDNQIADSASVSLLTGGVLDAGTRSETIGPLSFTGGTAQTTTGTLTLSANVTTNAAAVSASISGKLALGSAARTFTVADGGAGDDLAIGAIVSGAIGVGLEKAGPGRLTLSATNIYAGATMVSGGTLRVNGSIATSSLVTVGSGGRLEGSGTTGALTVAAGGTLAPGAGVGRLTTGDITLDSGSLFEMEISGLTPITGYDSVRLFSSTSLAGALSVTLLGGFVPDEGDVFFPIVNDSGDGGLAGTFAGLPQGAVFAAGGTLFEISYEGDSDLEEFTGGNDVMLRVVPEPSAAVLLAGAASLLLLRRARCRSRSIRVPTLVPKALR